SRRRHTRFSRDWSSDVCSSDLGSYSLRQTDNLLSGDRFACLYCPVFIVCRQTLVISDLAPSKQLGRPRKIEEPPEVEPEIAAERSEERRVGKAGQSECYT